jgi:hypothetical protein
LQHKYWRLRQEGSETLWPHPTIPPDRAKQAGYYPTHFAKAQPPHHYRDIFNHQPTYYPGTRLSIAHENLPHGTNPREVPTRTGKSLL